MSISNEIRDFLTLYQINSIFDDFFNNKNLIQENDFVYQIDKLIKLSDSEKDNLYKQNKINIKILFQEFIEIINKSFDFYTLRGLDKNSEEMKIISFRQNNYKISLDELMKSDFYFYNFIFPIISNSLANDNLGSSIVQIQSLFQNFLITGINKNMNFYFSIFSNYITYHTFYLQTVFHIIYLKIIYFENELIKYFSNDENIYLIEFFSSYLYEIKMIFNTQFSLLNAMIKNFIDKKFLRTGHVKEFNIDYKFKIEKALSELSEKSLDIINGLNILYKLEKLDLKQYIQKIPEVQEYNNFINSKISNFDFVNNNRLEKYFSDYFYNLITDYSKKYQIKLYPEEIDYLQSNLNFRLENCFEKNTGERRKFYYALEYINNNKTDINKIVVDKSNLKEISNCIKFPDLEDEALWFSIPINIEKNKFKEIMYRSVYRETKFGLELMDSGGIFYQNYYSSIIRLFSSIFKFFSGEDDYIVPEFDRKDQILNSSSANYLFKTLTTSKDPKYDDFGIFEDEKSLSNKEEINLDELLFFIEKEAENRLQYEGFYAELIELLLLYKIILFDWLQGSRHIQFERTDCNSDLTQRCKEINRFFSLLNSPVYYNTIFQSRKIFGLLMSILIEKTELFSIKYLNFNNTIPDSLTTVNNCINIEINRIYATISKHVFHIGKQDLSYFIFYIILNFDHLFQIIENSVSFISLNNIRSKLLIENDSDSTSKTLEDSFNNYLKRNFLISVKEDFYLTNRKKHSSKNFIFPYDGLNFTYNNLIIDYIFSNPSQTKEKVKNLFEMIDKTFNFIPPTLRMDFKTLIVKIAEKKKSSLFSEFDIKETDLDILE